MRRRGWLEGWVGWSEHGSGTDLHQHVLAVLEFEGMRESIEEADDLTRGQKVDVSVRVGRLSGIRRYVSYRKAD